MPRAHLNGLDVYYERTGEGRPVLFLNGSGATLDSMRMLLAPFTASMDLLAHDQRGLGETEVPPGPCSMADYAADALALLDHVGWEQCSVIGVSFGGMVAQELAVTAPERVDRLVLACTSPGGEGGSSYPLHELAVLPADERTATNVRILDTRFTSEWLAEHPGDQGLADLLAARADVEKSEEVRRGEALQLDARSRHDVWDRLPRITCPTLVAAGKYDGIAPRPNSEAIASRVPNAELRVYDGGHAFFAQDPKALPEMIAYLTAP